MNYFDFSVIYLACGAPFGVYYFLQNFRLKQNNFVWLKTIFVFVLWLPFALNLLLNKLSLNRSDLLTTNEEKKLLSVQKQIEAILLETDSHISIYGFREIFDRYVGLASAIFGDNEKPLEAEREIFRISPDSDNNVGAFCLHRRNLNRLAFHLNLARRDFLNTVIELCGSNPPENNLSDLSIEFVTLLKDEEAQNLLRKLFEEVWQMPKNEVVNHLEKVLWNPETRKPLTTDQISNQFQTMSAMNLPAKD